MREKTLIFSLKFNHGRKKTFSSSTNGMIPSANGSEREKKTFLFFIKISSTKKGYLLQSNRKVSSQSKNISEHRQSTESSERSRVVPFENRTIWEPIYFVPFKNRTRPVFGSPLYSRDSWRANVENGFVSGSLDQTRGVPTVGIWILTIWIPETFWIPNFLK